MRNYIFYLIITTTTLLGAGGGYYYRESFPAVTRFIHKDDDLSKKLTALFGGATVGFIGGIPASLLIEYLTNKKTKWK